MSLVSYLHLGVWPFLALSAMGGMVSAAPYSDPRKPVETRVEALVRAMTLDEKITMVFGPFGSYYAPWNRDPDPGARMGSAGYVPGIKRLGIPPQWITDAGLGVATQRESKAPYLERTALAAGISTAASWDPDVARRGGAMIARQARNSGFNILLAGGVNLVREPRGGRTFEYAGEDPLLAGTIVGASIAGIQSEKVISTVKHFAYNAQETGRSILSAELEESAARQSDLLAFEIAIETGKPGAVMCAYNRVDGVYACENAFLLSTVLKGDWKYPGYVMSDWGAVHSTDAAAHAGLDQQSAYCFDGKPYFGALLKRAVADGRVAQSRLDDMVARILRTMIAVGVYDTPVKMAPIDLYADRKISQAGSEQGIVLLKNAGVLPIIRGIGRVVVVGSHADKAVMSGGGSSTVFPEGGNAVPGIGPQGWPGPVVYLPSSPVAALMAALPETVVEYMDGTDTAAAVAAARGADLVLVFASQWSTEDADHDLSLPDGQDELIAAVAKANPKTAVVLQTGGPVRMPWLSDVAGVVEAWFPGSGGGEAIAAVLTGAVDAAGRLPVTFPQSVDQLPHPVLPGSDVPHAMPFAVSYSEGAAVGYKWFAKTGAKPLFPFGHGLSYTQFSFTNLSAHIVEGRLRVQFDVANIGERTGVAVPQIYVGAPAEAGWEAPFRLGGWQKVELNPGQARTLSVDIDPRILSRYDVAQRAWIVTAGTYAVHVSRSAADVAQTVRVSLPAERRGL